MTYESVESLKEGINRLRDGYEQLRSHLKNRDELSVDFIEETIEQQSNIISNIEGAGEIRAELKNTAPKEWQEWMNELESLREEAEDLLRDRLRAVDSELESVDKNLEVMETYKQDHERNYYLDETI